MANKKFTVLPTAASALITDIYCAVQAGSNVQLTAGQMAALFRDNLILNNAGDPNGSLAGNVYELCWDTSNTDLYICTTTGTSGTAVWTKIGGALIDPDMGGTGVASPTQYTLPVAQGSSAYSFVGPLADGELLIGTTV